MKDGFLPLRQSVVIGGVLLLFLSHFVMDSVFLNFDDYCLELDYGCFLFYVCWFVN